MRRLALFLEESLRRGTQWGVFEANDEALRAQLRLHARASMHTLSLQGTLQGMSPREAYFVAGARDITTQADIDDGVVAIQAGFAPLKPAEFVVLRVRLHAMHADDDRCAQMASGDRQCLRFAGS